MRIVLIKLTCSNIVPVESLTFKHPREGKTGIGLNEILLSDNFRYFVRLEVLDIN